MVKNLRQCTLILALYVTLCACSKSELGGGNVRKPQKYTSSQQGALKLILGKKYHWQLDRFSFLALPGYLNIKPLITPAVKDTLEKKWWWGNVFDLKEEPIYTFLTRLTPGGLMEWCAWFNWKAEQAPRPTNQPSRPHNLDPTFFTSEDTQWAGLAHQGKFLHSHPPCLTSIPI